MKKPKNNSKFNIRFDLKKGGKCKDSEESTLFLACGVDNQYCLYPVGYNVKPSNFITKVKTEEGIAYVWEVKRNTFNRTGVSFSTINKRIQTLKFAAIEVFNKNFVDSETYKIWDKDLFYNLLAIHLNEAVNEKKPLPISYVEVEKIAEKKANATDIFYWYEEYKNKMKVSEGRKKHYKADIKRLKEYSATLNYKLTFENIDVEHYQDWLNDGTRVDNTVVNIMKRLKAFFTHCKKKFKIIKTSLFDDIDFAEEIGVEKYDAPICLKKQELDKFYEYNFTDQEDRLIRDTFVLQCCFGCRVGDFMRMTYDI